MTSQKCQLKLGQKVHGPVTMDRFKTTYPFYFEKTKWFYFYTHVFLSDC